MTERTNGMQNGRQNRDGENISGSNITQLLQDKQAELVAADALIKQLSVQLANKAPVVSGCLTSA